MTDSDLLRQYARHRDPASFADLVRRHQAMVYGDRLRVLGYEADARDAAQDALIALAFQAAAVCGGVGAYLHGPSAGTAVLTGTVLIKCNTAAFVAVIMIFLGAGLAGWSFLERRAGPATNPANYLSNSGPSPAGTPAVPPLTPGANKTTCVVRDSPQPTSPAGRLNPLFIATRDEFSATNVPLSDLIGYVASRSGTRVIISKEALSLDMDGVATTLAPSTVKPVINATDVPGRFVFSIKNRRGIRPTPCRPRPDPGTGRA